MKSRVSHRAAFTLIELLVVIAILGVLMGVLVTQFGGATESARASKCLTNLRNLATAVHSYGMAYGHYPLAGSYEYLDENASTITYRPYHGWIGPAIKGVWGKLKNEPWKGNKTFTSPNISASWHQSTYADIDNDNGLTYHAITNGSLWSFTGKARGVYVCPEHARAIRDIHPVGGVIGWSYVMNGRFGYNFGSESEAISPDTFPVVYGGTMKDSTASKDDEKNRVSPANVLLFAEIPFVGFPKGNAPSKVYDAGFTQKPSVNSSAGSTAFDCTLQFDTKNMKATAESIGFNHKSGNHRTAHVAWADGHVSQVLLGKVNGGTDQTMLTRWFCVGYELSYSKSGWKMVTGFNDNKSCDDFQ